MSEWNELKHNEVVSALSQGFRRQNYSTFVFPAFIKSFFSTDYYVLNNERFWIGHNLYSSSHLNGLCRATYLLSFQ